jgi:hypothetical protein
MATESLEQLQTNLHLHLHNTKAISIADYDRPTQRNPAKLGFGLQDQKLANQLTHMIEILKYESIYIYGSYAVAPV